MEIKQAVRILEELWRFKETRYPDKDVTEALKMAIEALEKEGK